MVRESVDNISLSERTRTAWEATGRERRLVLIQTHIELDD